MSPLVLSIENIAVLDAFLHSDSFTSFDSFRRIAPRSLTHPRISPPGVALVSSRFQEPVSSVLNLSISSWMVARCVVMDSAVMYLNRAHSF